MRVIGLTAVVWALLTSVSAQVRFSEAMVNPPGSPDTGREFIELQSCQPNYPLTGLWLIGIDGEWMFNPGNIHWAIDLSSYTTGSNGLILIRDGSAVLLPAPAAATTVVVIQDAFTPAGMGNDSYTVALVRNFRGAPGNDIDANDDGTIDNPLWDAVLDAFGWLDGDVLPGETDAVYAAQMGGLEIPIDARRRDDNTIWEPDGILYFQNGSWIACDIGRAQGAGNFGPFETSNTSRVVNGSLPPQFNREVTPGNLNPGNRPAVAGDVDCNGCVDDADLLRVLFAFGQTGAGKREDVNSDSVVDDADLLIVLFNFGQGC
ncbi:MAG: hypothetical protein NZL85_03425 [Fimbriimonadales bacterium]|nr:hypothetical protein [Fimbriimonadales bacterium]